MRAFFLRFLPAPDAVSHAAPPERRSYAAREPAPFVDGKKLFRAFFSAPVTRPILIRLDLGGAACPPRVEVDAEWLPRRERTNERVLSASSMLLLPWRGDAESAELSVRVGERVGRATITRAANADGSVLEIRVPV